MKTTTRKTRWIGALAILTLLVGLGAGTALAGEPTDPDDLYPDDVPLYPEDSPDDPDPDYPPLVPEAAPETAPLPRIDMRQSTAAPPPAPPVETAPAAETAPASAPSPA